MESSTTEEITNFWSHFPNGLPYRDLCRMPRQERLERAARPAAVVTLAAEVELAAEIILELQPVSTEESSHVVAA